MSKYVGLDVSIRNSSANELEVCYRKFNDKERRSHFNFTNRKNTFMHLRKKIDISELSNEDIKFQIEKEIKKLTSEHDRVKLFAVKGSIENQLLRNNTLGMRVNSLGMSAYKDNINFGLESPDTDYSIKPILPKPEDVKKSSSAIHLNMNFNRDLRFKTNRLGIKGYGNEQDLTSNENELFKESFLFQESDLIGMKRKIYEAILPHIEFANSKNKKLVLHTDSRTIELINAINKDLKSNDKAPINYKIVNGSVNSRDNKVAQRDIENFIKKKFDDVSNLENKNVIYVDGSFNMNSPKIEQKLGAGFTIETKDKGGVTGVISQEQCNDLKSCHGAEILGLKKALESAVEHGFDDKKLTIVFDSGLVFNKLSQLLDGIEVTGLGSENLNAIGQLIRENNLKIDSLVIKSHWEGNIISNSHKEIIANNDVVDLLAKKGMRKKGNSEDIRVTVKRKI